jgi:hypothetical protein
VERPHRAAMVRNIALAEQAADCSKSIAVGAAVHRSTTAADSCRPPRCCSSKNPFLKFLFNIFIIIRYLYS